MRLILSSLRFEDTALKELAESIRTEGVLSPLLVRPLTENGFEIVAGARRYRAAQMAEAATVPVRIVNLNDAEALEAQLIELSIVGKSFSLSLCDLGASFIWNRRGGLIPNCWIQRNAAAPCNAVADSRFGTLVIRLRIPSNYATGNSVY
jgi:hypothetical protein